MQYTEDGLRELGLNDLAECFRAARDLMVPLLNGDRTLNPDETLEQNGLEKVGNEINQRAWDLDRTAGENKSLIYSAWVSYARRHPEQVFGD